MLFRIRVDDYGVDARASITKLLTNAQQFVWVHHQINDNPHWHVYLDNPNYMSCQAVRYHLRKTTDNPSNYSVKKCDEDKKLDYIQYLFNQKHGNKWTIEDTSFDQVIVDECIKRAATVAEVFNEKRPKARSLYEMAMEVHETTPNDDELIQAIIKCLHRYMKCHDDFMIIKVLTTISTMRDINLTVERIRRKIM